MTVQVCLSVSCRRTALLLGVCVPLACESPKLPPKASATQEPEAPRAKTPVARTPAAAAPKEDAPVPQRKTRFPAAPRVVAFGDVHGDLSAAKAALKLAGAIDDTDHWSGGGLVVVQTGDQLDRGDEEQAILDLFDELAGEASRAGGALHVLNGNHELMNVAGDLRYVTPGGLDDFADVEGLDLADPRLSDLDPKVRPRAAAFSPGGLYARKLAQRNTAVIVGKTVFVHGGVEPQYAARLDELNNAARTWLWKSDAALPAGVRDLMAPDGLVWTRRYSEPTPSPADCTSLAESLNAMSVDRMVVGHTVQKDGITSACDDKIWRVDVGMAAHYGGKPAVLEITADGVRPITAAK